MRCKWAKITKIVAVVFRFTSVIDPSKYRERRAMALLKGWDVRFAGRAFRDKNGTSKMKRASLAV
jgi:hypothetical protein